MGTIVLNFHDWNPVGSMVDLSTLFVYEYGLLFLYLYLCSYVRLGSWALLTRFSTHFSALQTRLGKCGFSTQPTKPWARCSFLFVWQIIHLKYSELLKPHCTNNVCTDTKTISNSSGNRTQLLPWNPGPFVLYLLSQPATVRVWLLLANPYSWSLSPQSLSLTTHTTRNPRWAEYRTDVEDLTPIVELTPAPLPLLAPQMCQQSMSLLFLRGLSSLHGGHCSRQHSL